MTEEQFEALKAWICAMRDADRAFAATDWGNNEARWEDWCEAVTVLKRAEVQARAALVEDKP